MQEDFTVRVVLQVQQASDTEQCKYCGQKLLPMYNFK